MHTHDLARREMIARLETYREKKRRIEILKYEQMNFPSVSAEEIIEGMALSSPLGTIKGYRHFGSDHEHRTELL